MRLCITLTSDNLTLAKAFEIADMSVIAELDAALLRWSSTPKWLPARSNITLLQMRGHNPQQCKFLNEV